MTKLTKYQIIKHVVSWLLRNACAAVVTSSCYRFHLFRFFFFFCSVQFFLCFLQRLPRIFSMVRCAANFFFFYCKRFYVFSFFFFFYYFIFYVTNVLFSYFFHRHSKHTLEIWVLELNKLAQPKFANILTRKYAYICPSLLRLLIYALFLDLLKVQRGRV